VIAEAASGGEGEVGRNGHFLILHFHCRLVNWIGLIAKLRHFVPQHTLLNIYRALILPYLSYGLIVWGQASKTHLTKILLLQKKVIRFIFFASRKVHAIPFFIDANILPISFLYFKSVSYLMHDIHTNSAPSKIVLADIIYS